MNTGIRPTSRVDRYLVGIVAVCAALVTLETIWPHPLVIADAGEARTPERVSAPSPEPKPLSPLAAYQVVADEPLFTKSRRPYEPAPDEPPERPTRPAPRVVRPSFELSAVITSPTTRIALLKSDRAASAMKLKTGQRIEGWTVAEIHADAVLLRHGDEALTVKLLTKGDSNDDRT